MNNPISNPINNQRKYWKTSMNPVLSLNLNKDQQPDQNRANP